MSDISDSDAVVIGRDDISNYNPHHILPQPPEALAKIREWLQPTDYSLENGEFRKHLASRAEGTGAWLTSSSIYREWLQSGELGTVWLKGIPGSGKSVLTAGLIDQLSQAEPDSPVLYFFFRQIIDANHQPDALLRDWLDQVLVYSPPLQQQLKTYVDTQRSRDSLSMDDLWKDFKSALAGLSSRVYCVADALDEMDRGHEAFIQALAGLGEWNPHRVKVVITSRPIPVVERALRNAKLLEVRLQQNIVDVDISTYVRAELQASNMPTADRRLIKAAIPGRANGLFIYAKLAMDAFLEPGARPEQVLKRLPTNLNHMYTSILEEHLVRSGVPHRIQRLILQSVTHASRPLRLLELADVIQLTCRSDNGLSLRAAKDLVRAACGPLLEILPDETVCVVHHSFTEYLKGSTRSDSSAGYPVLVAGSTHQDLALACMDYLQAGCLSYLSTSQPKTHQEEYLMSHGSTDLTHPKNTARLNLEYPFVEYAAANWHIHTVKSARAGCVQDGLNETIARFLGNQLLSQAWVQLQWPREDVKGATQLHIAARTGIDSYATALLDDAQLDVDTCDGKGRTALWWAASCGRADLIRLLVSRGADPNADDREDGLRPLHEAAMKNFPEVVKALLAAGVDPLTPRTRGTPKGFCGNRPRTQGHTPLMKVIGNTPLFLACRCASVDSVTALIAAGADPSILSDDADESTRFLHPRLRDGRAEATDYPVIFSLLVEAGVDIHERTMRGTTALHEAVNSPVMCRLLLDAGADANATDEEGASPLHRATSVETVALLVEHGGADINQRQKDGLTPLLSMARAPRWEDDCLAKIIEYSPDCNVVDREGRSPLHHAAKGDRDNTSVIRSLLEKGADPNATDHTGVVPLHWCDGLQNLDALLEGGADLNARGSNGAKLLFRQMWKNQKLDLKPLLDRGLSITVRDLQGRTVLHEAVKAFPANYVSSMRESKAVRIEYLVQLGLDPLARDYRGNNLLHELAARHSPYESPCNELGKWGLLWGYLTSLGIDPAQTNDNGRTPLHLLCSKMPPSTPAKSVEGVLDVVLSSLQLDPQWHVDNADCDGITPLHLASTRSEACAQRLLRAGADPAKPTFEGRSPLHLACQSRESNIVGMLLDKFTLQEDMSDASSTEPEDADIDARDNASHTPLFYACRSGRPETVAILLDAGAQVNPEEVLLACAGFETEQDLWDTPQEKAEDDLDTGGLRLNDKSRPFVKPTADSDRRTTRINDILDMLLARLPNKDSLAYIAREVDMAISDGRDRTASLLISFYDQAREKFSREDSDPEPPRRSWTEFLSKQRTASETKPLHKFKDLKTATLYRNQLWDILCRREFTLVEDCCRNHIGLFQPGPMHSEDETMFSILVSAGFTWLARKALQIRRDAKEASIESESGAPGWDKDIGAMVSRAVCRELPNMEMIRMLVDEFGMDINQAEYVRDRGRVTDRVRTSALLEAARSRHWWHKLAARYLIERKANLEIRNAEGQTPLHLALGGPAPGCGDFRNVGPGPFNRDVARDLVLAGVDVNAIDYEGRSCLAYAVSDAILVHLLIDHGAEVRADALFAAIKSRDASVLNVMLSSGISPNARRDARGALNDPILKKRHRKQHIKHHEVYPLYYAATLPSKMTHGGAGLSAEMRRRRNEDDGAMLDMLLAYGADPFALFSQEPKSAGEDDDGQTPEKPGVVVGQGHRKSMVLHDLVMKGELVQPFLESPRVDIERRDPSGRTILLAACSGRLGPDSPVDLQLDDKHFGGQSTAPSILSILLQRGANPRACDETGRNALHLMLRHADDREAVNSSFNASLAHLATAVPGLVNQKDVWGKTPLRLAAAHAVLWRSTQPVRTLLAAGADPLVVDDNGDTCLHILAQNLDSPELRGLFQDLVARCGQGILSARNNRGETPAFGHFLPRHSARRVPVIAAGDESRMDKSQVWAQEEDGVAFLEALGADLHARNGEGKGLLHLVAADKGSGLRFRALRQRGLDPLMEDNAQRTPLDQAAACRHTAILGLFQEKGE
ncbi:ankyrin repeat-containing domain protein [Xylariaceae sp. FL0804]|nr:ankyrin repeat-containing domain protein [Xylariaceae sp. FL0804]